MGEITTSAMGTVILYVVFAAIGALASLNPVASAIFTIIQLLLLLGDVEYADKSNRLLQNFIGGFLNALIGYAVHDTLAYVGGIAVIAIVVLKFLDKL